VTPLSVFLIVLAGVTGVAVGSFLNVVAYRVPAGISLLRESRCPQCDAPIRTRNNLPVISWFLLRGRCADCGSPISPRYPLVEAVTGVAFAAAAWWGVRALAPAAIGPVSSGDVWALWLVVIAFLYFAAISVALTLIDLDTRRLPNAIVLPSYAVAGILFTLAAALGAQWDALLRAGIGMVVLYAFYLLLRSVRPGGMGGGDVKLAGVVGMYLGWTGWGALAVGSFAAFLYGGIFGVLLLIAGRAGRRTAIPFGPWMLLGAWTGVLAGDAIGLWYVDLVVGV